MGQTPESYLRATRVRVSGDCVRNVQQGLFRGIGGSHNGEPSKNFGNALPQAGDRAVPAISRVNRRSCRLHEIAARKGRYTPAKWTEVQQTLEAKRRLRM